MLGVTALLSSANGPLTDSLTGNRTHPSVGPLTDTMGRGPAPAVSGPLADPFNGQRTRPSVNGVRELSSSQPLVQQPKSMPLSCLRKT
jgi:hypothetical protein